MRVELLSYSVKDGFKGRGTSGNYRYDFCFKNEADDLKILKRSKLCQSHKQKNGLPDTTATSSEMRSAFGEFELEEILVEEILCGNTLAF